MYKMLAVVFSKVLSYLNFVLEYFFGYLSSKNISHCQSYFFINNSVLLKLLK